MAATVIEHRPQQQQFVLALENGPCATVNYRKQDGKLYLIHAEVPSELRGHRVGKELVERPLNTLKRMAGRRWRCVPMSSWLPGAAASGGTLFNSGDGEAGANHLPMSCRSAAVATLPSER